MAEQQAFHRVRDHRTGFNTRLRLCQRIPANQPAGVCPRTLVPYGVDIDPSRIDAARTMFNSNAAHFVSPQDVKSLNAQRDSTSYTGPSVTT